VTDSIETSPRPGVRLLFLPERVAGEGGVRLAAYRFGGAGPPVMLVHATGFHAHVWLPLLERLRAHYTLFGFDLRGHGESETPAEPEAYRYRRMAHDVLAVADHFRLDRFAGIGHSVGGALLVQAEIDRPGTVTRAVLFEPIVLPPEQTEQTAAAMAARTRRTVFGSTDEMLARWSARPPFNAFATDALRAYVEFGVRDRPDGTVELKCSREAEVATFVQDTQTGIWAQLGRYGTPTLILAGDRSTSRAAPVAERQAREMPDARVERLPDLSHFLPFERPREMADRAIAFIG
jgi:pimeloyl-ACP methyl ester carboxylesterase